MRIIHPEGRVIWSASDLKAAAECEFSWCRRIDARLGRVAEVEEPEDAMLARAAALGDAHELRVLEAYRRQLGESAVIELPKVSSADAAALQSAVEETLAALRSEARLVFQAAFSTSEFVGFADFLLRDDEGRWRVQDSKLARAARGTALMQLAAYVDQLDRLGIPRADEVDLLLGDGQTSTHRVDDILPLFFVRRARLRALIADRRIDEGAAGEPLAWGDERGELEIRACGRCATCEEQAIAHRDLLMVARMRPVHRTKLRDAGIATIDELAVASEAPAGMNPEVFASLRAQAALQVAAGAAPEGPPPFEAYHPQAVHDLPRPSPGDLFFDFEGDPLYTEPPAAGKAAEWGLDYLFGWVDHQEQYTALWAHSFAEEKEALLRFLEVVAEIRRAHPGMHIYHYAPYETAHLTSIAARHGVGEVEVAALLREGVFVDLYPLVLRTVRIGDRSYSIKKLEPLYMGEEVRTSEVKKGDDSITEYVRARALHAEGAEHEAEQILRDLAEYNRYDCVSTRRLRDWLIDIAREAGVSPAPADEPDERSVDTPAQVAGLLAEAERADDEGRDAGLYRFGAAAISYYPREASSFWQAHFQRLREPIALWASTKDVVHVDPARTTVERDWSVAEGMRVLSRDIAVRGEIAPGTTLGAGARPFVLYARPTPFPASSPSRSVYHPLAEREIVETLADGYLLRETAVHGEVWDELPVALTPPAPPRVASLQGAIEEWADRLLAAAPAHPADAATDILRRLAPRTVSGQGIPGDGEDAVEAIVRAVRDLDHSYLAVQGPPGTGKTYTGSHVIARLVRDHGYRVGVVAQSHAIVEEMLTRVVDRGVPAAQVGKAPKVRTGEEAYTAIAKTRMAAFLAEHAGKGAVVGGTAWDFSNITRVARGELDLLVIDEAGQFSLASTIAVAAGAKRVLLLGDPQQLPQVSQGTHPEPVDTSALGWVMGGEPVIARTHGYFLSHSHRMHPAVAEPVSRLAYAGQLESAGHTVLRLVEGIEPGVWPVPVRHRGNAVDSPEEAARVVELVREVIGRRYTDSSPEGTIFDPRPITEEDIIVVTPYNAQKQLVQEALAAAGLGRVPVGTVDNFQGQEAVVSITSLAASSGRDAPRGSEFLLLQNRLNVAVSRAKSVAYVVYSPGLLDDLPYTPEGVARLSAFARLVGADSA